MAQEMEGLISRRDGDGSLELSPSIVYIEACENYQKQSYRNRCRFYAADGVQALSFPIVHEGGTHKLPISEIKVDYSTPWLLQPRSRIVYPYLRNRKLMCSSLMDNREGQRLDTVRSIESAPVAV